MSVGYGVSGWKARQERARMKNSKGKTAAERAAIREARAALYAQQAATVAPDPFPASTPEPTEPTPDDDYQEMTREEMVAELEAAGIKVHPNSKDETLARKVESLRNG